MPTAVLSPRIYIILSIIVSKQIVTKQQSKDYRIVYNKRVIVDNFFFLCRLINVGRNSFSIRNVITYAGIKFKFNHQDYFVVLLNVSGGS